MLRNKIYIQLFLFLILISNISYGQHYSDWTGFEFVKQRKPVLGTLVFNELVKDYTINLSEYFTDANKLPELCRDEVGFYYSWASSLPSCAWDFILLEPGGILTVRKGYRWDGATNGGEDEIYNHRSSLIHDVLYDLMRMGYLEPDLFDIGDPSESDNSGDFNRKMADMLYFMMAIEDGESVEKAESDFIWIRAGGWIGTSTEFQLKDWKFHISDLTAYTLEHSVLLEWRRSDVYQINPDLVLDKSYILLRDGEVYDVVTAHTCTYRDENVVIGEFYSYQIIPNENSKNEYDWSNIEYVVPNTGLGNSAEFNGLDNYFITNTLCNDICYDNTMNSDQYSYNFTLEARVLPEAKAGKNSIWAFNTIVGEDLIMLLYDGDHQKLCYYDETTGYLLSCNEYLVNEWYHIAMTFDSLNNASLYVNGNREISFSTQLRPSYGDRFSIGQEWDYDTASQFFKGTIDEVRIWKKRRSEEEITRDMLIPLTGNEQDLVCLWHFDEPLDLYTVSYWGDIIIENAIMGYDATSYGNDGIFNGKNSTPIEVIHIDENKPYLLNHNFPNPFSRRTVIRFSIPVSDYIALVVYNLEGKKIEVLADSFYTAGTHEIDWHARDISNGMYVCKLTSREFSAAFKMILE